MNICDLLSQYERIETEAYQLMALVRVGRPVSPVILRERWYDLLQLIQLANSLLRDYVSNPEGRS